VLEALGLVVDLIPAVTQHLHEEHFEEAMVPDELDGHLAALAGQLLAAVAVVLDEPLRAKPRHHLADAGRRDAQPLSQLTRRHRALVAVEEIKGLEVVLL